MADAGSEDAAKNANVVMARIVVFIEGPQKMSCKNGHVAKFRGHGVGI